MSIASAQRHHGYPTVDDYTLSKRKIEVLGEIDFRKFGGRNEYFLCRNMYWYAFHNKKNKEDVAKKFGQTVDEVERRNKLFRRWLNEPVKRY